MGRGLMPQKRAVGGSQGPAGDGQGSGQGMHIVRTTNPASSSAAQRQSLRSHSPGQNNFMSGGHQKTVKLQKNQISQGGSGNSAGVFGTNNMMFGNYTGGQQTGVLSSNTAGAQ